MCNIGCWSERWKGEWADLFQALSRVYHWVLIWLLRMIKLVAILNEGCKHHSILKIIVKMWIARFS